MPVSTPIQSRPQRRPITTYLYAMVAHRGLIVYRVQDPGWHARVSKSRDGHTIGFAIVAGRVCSEFKWGRP